MPSSTLSKDTQAINIDGWFERFVEQLRIHQLQIQTRTAPKEMESVYMALAQGNDLAIAKNIKPFTQKTFVGAIILKYLELLGESKPNKLAFDFNDSSVLAWAEIDDDDEEMESFLLIAEAKVNAEFQDCGFCMSSTIVEKSDNLTIPNHYRVFIE